MTEKIGNDILGSKSMQAMSPKKKKEIEAKVKEEKAKKQTEEVEQKLPDLAIPNDEHTPRLGEHGYDEIQKEIKGVHVNEHKRGRPKKRDKQPIEVV